MYPEKLSDDDDDDPFEGEEMMNLKELCSKLSNDCLMQTTMSHSAII